jgi:phage terminase Nu1 subunit (DNA packaging protein)
MSLESLSRLSDLSGFAPRTIKTRIERLTPIKEGSATLYETRDALALMYRADQGEKLFDLEQERARLSHHQANREALKEGIERGELIP